MARIAASLFVALMLAGCAGGRSPFGGTTAATPASDMAGRWILAAPDAPTCGMNFTGPPGAHAGNVSPEGGCPEKFYQSRTWTLEQNSLMIIGDDNTALAQFTLAGPGFEGSSAAGTPVTLTRQPTLEPALAN